MRTTATPRRRKKPRRSRGSGRSVKDLTREKVIQAGLSLVDREGSGRITMRRLADVLGVTPMALYNHVSSKKDLLRAIAVHVLSEARFDGHHDDWREQIRCCFRVFRSICVRHPGLARLLETADVPPAAVSKPMEVTLRALEDIGLDAPEPLQAYFTLVGFTLSHASYQSRGPFPDLEPSEKIRADRLAGRGYGTIERLDTSDQWDFDAAFEFGLTLIIAGLESIVRRGRG